MPALLCLSACASLASPTASTSGHGKNCSAGAPPFSPGRTKRPGWIKCSPSRLQAWEIVRPGRQRYPPAEPRRQGLAGSSPAHSCRQRGRPPALSHQEPGHLSRPAQIILRQHRQVEQPLARIVDDLQIQRGGIFKMAQQGVIRTVAQRETDLAPPRASGLAGAWGWPYSWASRRRR